MPRTPVRLPLTQSTGYQPIISSSLRVPPSPTSPRTPLHPPARLHLQPVKPNPPLSPHILAHHPEEPLPFVWTCHLCGSIYRLGVTSRCLEDGHTFCSLPSPPSSPGSSFTTSPYFTSSEEDLKLLARAAIRRKRNRHRVRGCRTEFDYASWEIYNVWRREISFLRKEKVGKDEFEGERTWGDNCYTDCDFPSQCHNSRLQRLRLMRHKAIEEDPEQLKIAQVWEEIRERMEREKEAEEMLEDAATPPGLAEALCEEEFVLKTEQRGLENSAMKVGVNMGEMQQPVKENYEEKSGVQVDESGDREVEFVEKKNKKRNEKIKQLTGLIMGIDVEEGLEWKKPSSPLKQEFGVEDLMSEDVEELRK